MSASQFGGPREDVLVANLKNDLQAVEKFDNEQFNQLVQMIFAFLADPSKSSQLLNQLETFSEDNSVSLPGLKNVFKSLLTIPNNALKKGSTAATFNEELRSLGLSEEKADYFSEQWKKNMATLSSMALDQTLMVNRLVDVDWKFGVTLASSEITKVGNTFVQLKLVLSNGTGEMKNAYMELSLQQFYSFLHEMERVKASLEILS